MKLISFLRDGKASYGCVTPNGVLDLGRFLGGEVPDLKSLLADNLLDLAASHAAQDGPRVSLSDLRLLPVIPKPGKIVCVGLNYHEHVKETQRQNTQAPTLFLRVAESQVGHAEDMVLPAESTQFDYEGEIAVIVGKPGRRIAASRAFEHIAGYACYNDGSVRDWQAASNQWTAGKNFWRTGAFGPWMVTSDEIAPSRKMTLVTRLNGREMQRATTDMMIHGIAELISHISTFTPLEAGDVIVTGTPGGIGSRRVPPVFLTAGDIVEVEIDAIGTLKNTVACEVAETDGVFCAHGTRFFARSG